MKLQANKEYKINGYRGKWYMVDHNELYALMESTTWGDEAPTTIVYYDSILDNDIDIIHMGLGETYDDINTAMYDWDLIEEYQEYIKCIKSKTSRPYHI